MPQEPRRYEVLGVIGRGGFGAVYKARMRGNAGFHKLVALKMPNPDAASEEHLGRLRDEARLLGLISHRAIVGVTGLEMLSGRWAVVMEFIDGVDLETVLDHHRTIDPKAALQIVAETADALHVAYNTEGPQGQILGLLHRDIKPGNLLVTPIGEVKILDFGIARAEFEARESETKDVNFGSAGYMSPERIDAIDHQTSDVYSLGVVLYEMLAGEPLGKTSANEDRHAEKRAGALLELRVRGIPDEAIDLVDEMLAFSAEDRPPARVCSTRARRMAERMEGESLRIFAKRAVPGLQDARWETDTLTGVELIQDSLEPPPALRPQAAQGSLVVPILVGGTLALLLLLGLVGLGALRAVGPERSGLELTPEATRSLPPFIATDPGPRLPLLRKEAPPPTRRRARRPASPRMAQVEVIGDPATIELIGEAGRFEVPGPVPPGTYQIQAAFGPTEAHPAGKIEVRADTETLLYCNSLFERCEAN